MSRTDRRPVFDTDQVFCLFHVVRFCSGGPAGIFQLDGVLHPGGGWW